MESTTPCQLSNANTNQFLLIIIRLLATVGFSYLLSALYRLLRRLLLSRDLPHDRVDASAEEENIGVNLNDSPSVSRVSLELDFGSYDGGDLGIRVPEPAYHPRGRR